MIHGKCMINAACSDATGGGRRHGRRGRRSSGRRLVRPRRSQQLEQRNDHAPRRPEGLPRLAGRERLRQVASTPPASRSRRPAGRRRRRRAAPLPPARRPRPRAGAEAEVGEPVRGRVRRTARPRGRSAGPRGPRRHRAGSSGVPAGVDHAAVPRRRGRGDEPHDDRRRPAHPAATRACATGTPGSTPATGRWAPTAVPSAERQRAAAPASTTTPPPATAPPGSAAPVERSSAARSTPRSRSSAAPSGPVPPASAAPAPPPGPGPRRAGSSAGGAVVEHRQPGATIRCAPGSRSRATSPARSGSGRSSASRAVRRRRRAGRIRTPTAADPTWSTACGGSRSPRRRRRGRAGRRRSAVGATAPGREQRVAARRPPPARRRAG